VKPILLAVAGALLISALPLPAKASLGSTVASVQTDRARMRSTLSATRNDRYTVDELKTPAGVTVREYVSPGGQVFAITWQGTTRPDLQQLLGTYSETFKEAVQAKQKTSRILRGPLMIKEPGLVVQMAGHMRWLVGRAYVPGMVPSNVQVEEIR
jgi:hypothetical protein